MPNVARNSGSTRGRSWLPAIGAGLALAAIASRSAAEEEPCASLARQTNETVIAFDPPSAFTICRGGRTEGDVVTGRRVYVELLPRAGTGLFVFRVHGRASEPAVTGLKTAADRARELASGLGALASSSEGIAEAGPTVSEPSAAVAHARALYLGVATPRFHELASSLEQEAGELSGIATTLGHWCGELSGADVWPPIVAARMRADCASPDVATPAVEKAVATLTGTLEAFEAHRDTARDALVEARAAPTDLAAQARAAAALDEARGLAARAQQEARALARVGVALSREARVLRQAVRGTVGILRPGVPLFLQTFADSGTASLEIDATPVSAISDTADEEPEAKPPAPSAEASSQTFRFQIVGRHFLDLEAGLGYTGGVPAIPTVGAQGGAQIIEGKGVDQFVAMALVELEPLRFVWPDRPLAGLLRFPVLAVPLTRDPTQNFFGGVGLGWTGVGSIAAGPYVARELTLSPGYAVGQPVPAGSSIGTITGPALHVGYFVSASVDLLGLFHLFVPVHESTFDAGTGKAQ